MMKVMSRAMVTAAAASMAIAPIAAQANTRAGDGAPVYTSSVAKPGTARSADGEKLAGSANLLLLLFTAAAVIGGITVAASNDDNDDNGNQSPGT